MEQVNINFKMSKTLKENFEKTCEDIGISLSSAFNIFAKAVVRENRIPFEVSGKLNASIDTSIINPLLSTVQRKIQISNISDDEIDEIIKSLTGIITNNNENLTDYKNERLSKYENCD